MLPGLAFSMAARFCDSAGMEVSDYIVSSPPGSRLSVKVPFGWGWLGCPRIRDRNLFARFPVSLGGRGWRGSNSKEFHR